MVAKGIYFFNHFGCFLCAVIIFLSKGRTSDGCLCLEKIGEKALQFPTILTHANDGSKRMFVGELTGVVNIYYPSGLISPEPFIDIRPIMKVIPDNVFADQHTWNEYGLLGMAFHPHFRENRLFYLHFTRQSERPGPFYRTTIGEFRVSSTDSEKADPSYFRVILDMEKDTQHHDGGQLLFGDDGYLYAFTGDGGEDGDPHQKAQNLERLEGKVLRVDVNHPTENAGYSIPSDNPFLNRLPDGGTIPRPEIFAYGLRNPWRCDIDRGDPNTGAGKGRIICGDGGQSRMEELDLIEKGANYGWNNFEGTSRYCYKCRQGIPGKIPTDPIHAFARTRINRAVIGGRFYRGCSIQNIDGAFVYGHLGGGKIFRLLETGLGNWESEELAICAAHQCQGNLTTTYAPWIMSFGLDEDGELYLLSSYDPAVPNYNGNIYRLVDPEVTAEQIDACRSKQKKWDLNVNLVDHIEADANVSQVLVNTAASEVDATVIEEATTDTAAGEVDTTASGEIITKIESNTHTVEAGATASEVGETVSEADAPYSTAPKTTPTQPSALPSTVADSATPTPTAGLETANQEHQSGNFLEANNAPVITDDNNIDDSNIVPIVEGIQAVLETAADTTLEELIDDLENKVLMKLFPFGSIQTVIGPPNSPEEAETTLDNSNSSEDDSSDSSDDDD